MKNLIIIGAGGHGRVCQSIAKSMARYENIMFLDDHVKSNQVINNCNHYKKYINSQTEFFVGIGDNHIRGNWYKQLKSNNAQLAKLIHPTAIVDESVEIDLGTILMPGVIVNCQTTIGEGVILNSGCIVEHDSTIQDYVHLSPGVTLGGTVKIGNYTWIGINATVKNNIQIMDNIIVGAGAVVVKNIMTKNNSNVFFGNPARNKESS